MAAYIPKGIATVVMLAVNCMAVFLMFPAKRHTFQKIFTFFLQFLLTIFQSSLASAIATIFIPAESSDYFIVWMITLFILAGYAMLVVFWCKRILKRLFIDGSEREWPLYAFSAAFLYVVLAALRITS